jgi:GPI-Mannosyltransferase II co-activator
MGEGGSCACINKAIARRESRCAAPSPFGTRWPKLLLLSPPKPQCTIPARKPTLTPASDLASAMEFSLLALLLLHVCVVFCNTEKVIFLGPRQLQVPVEHPTLEDLQLEALSPQHWSLRTHLRAEFPATSSKYGQASWFLLNGLQEGRRYEVRICWAATVRLTLDDCGSS